MSASCSETINPVRTTMRPETKPAHQGFWMVFEQTDA